MLSTRCCTFATAQLQLCDNLADFKGMIEKVPHKRRVLVVDDCSDTRVVFRHLLESLGAEVTTAADGEMAQQTVITAQSEGRPFELIFMDIRMPKMNGMNAAKLIRDAGYSGKIAACTADCSAIGRKESKASGIDVYFDKRVVNKELFSALLDQKN